MATMNETVVIKIKGDATDLEQSLSKSTSKLKELGKAGGSSLGMSAEAADQLHNSLEGIRGMSFTGMVAGIANLATSWKTAKDYAKEYSHHAKIAKDFLDKNSWVYNGADKIMDWAGEAEALENYKEHMKLANDEMKNGQEQGGLLFTILHSGAGKAAIAIAGVAAALVAVVAQVRMAIRTAQQIKQVNAEAAKIGLSVQAYQQWGFVLESVGVQADELSSFIKTLSDEQAQMAEGSEGASKAFETLGMSIGDVINMNQEQLFTETVSRLQNVENAVERTKIAYQIFGEDAAHLANVMNMSNQQMRALINNYNELGGGASQTLVEKSTTLSYALSQLRQAWTGLTNALAELFMPVITAVVNWLTRAIAIVRMFLQAIFNLDSSPAAKSGANMAQGMGSYTKATNNATKAVQKLKRELMGFDELNKLSGEDSGSAGAGNLDFGGGGGGIAGGGFELPKMEDLGLDKWREWIEKYKGLVHEITVLSLIIIGMVGAALCLCGGNWIGAIGFAALAGIGFAAGSTEGGAFETGFVNIQAWFEKIWQAFKDFIAPAVEAWDKFWKDVGQALDDGCAAIKKGFEDGWKAVSEWYKTNVAPVFIKEWWAERWDNLKKAANEKLTELKNSAIGQKWQEIKDWFAQNVAPKFTKQYWLTKWDNLKTAAGEKIEAVKTTIKQKWESIKSWFSSNIAPKFTISYWTNKFQSIPNAVKTAFNSAIGFVESAVNKIVDKLNTLHWSIPWWVPGVGGNSFGFSLNHIYIPRLATGGIATRSTLANIGENGREAVLPLDNNTEWMDALADKISARNAGPTKLVLNVDGKELGWATINGINGITKQTGELQLRLGQEIEYVFKN